MRTISFPAILLFACLTVASFLPTFAQPGTWAIQAGGARLENPSALAVDVNGNSYVAGQFSDTATFGTQTLISRGETDIFVAKYNRAGDFMWVNQYGWKENDYASAIELDQNGNVFVAGEYQDSSVFNNDTLYINQFSADTFGISDGKVDIFVMKLDTLGNYFWVRDGGGWGSEFVNDLKIRSNGEMIMCGQYRTRLMLNDTSANSGYEDIFWTKTDVFGNFILTRTAGGSFYESAVAMELVKDTALYIAGHFQDTLYFNDSSASVTSLNDEDIFLAKYNVDGSFRWVIEFGGRNDERVTDMVHDDFGNIYLSGYFQDTLDIQGVRLISNGNYDAFLIKFNANGGIVWARSGGGPQYDVIQALSISQSGNIGVTGFFQDVATFDAYSLNSGSPFNQDVLFGSIDLNGNANWYRTAGGVSTDGGRAIGFDPDGYAVVLGDFGDSAWFGDQKLVAAGNLDMFLMRIDENGSVSIDDPAFAEEMNLDVWPVPAKDYVNIRLETENPSLDLRLIDLNGRAVQTQSLQGQFGSNQYDIRLPLGNLPAGIYILQVQGESFEANQKIIIAK